MKAVNIEVLPHDVQKELLDFYEYLVNKYVESKGEDKSWKKRKIFECIEKHSFDLPGNYKFNRDKLYER